MQTAGSKFHALTAIGLSCLVTLLAIEGAFRLFYERASILQVQGNVSDWFRTRYPAPNEFGYREGRLADLELDATYRILFLGDSFTFGQGIPREEDRFSNLIEARLNRESDSSRRRFHVFNAGQPGTDPGVWIEDLARLLGPYRPHAVFAIFFLRDGTAMCTSLRCHEEEIAKIRAPYDRAFWFRHSYLGHFIGARLIRREFSEYYVAQLRDGYLGNDDQTSTWRLQQQYLREIRDTCARAGASFHLVIFPMLLGLESNYRFHTVENEIRRFAEREKIPWFSLTPGFMGRRSADLWVAPDDQHPNELGHRIAADTLFPYVKQSVSE